MDGVVVNPEGNPNKESITVTDNREKEEMKKPKVVVVMGASGSGKSRLAIDLASYFPIEIINADSMQVYEGLDVLTNKVPLPDRKGVPHHLLGTISPSVEFTSKDFRDSAIPIIDDILSRNCLPIIVGGTNYYIQALVSPFLLDDLKEDMDECCLNSVLGAKQPDHEVDLAGDSLSISYNRLKELDPDAANRIHPNDHRKSRGWEETSPLCLSATHMAHMLEYWMLQCNSIKELSKDGPYHITVNHYLSLYAHCGVLPSKLFQGTASERWGRVNTFRYDCCFICMDASLPVLDRYVEQRVDSMIDAGLLNEVYDMYNPNAVYTRGLCQAIGVREFEDFLRVYLFNKETYCSENIGKDYNSNAGTNIRNCNFREILDSSDDSHQKILLREAIEKLKMNTRRLVRRQKRRLNRLQTFFGWDLHYVDATEALLCNSDESWLKQVVQPAVNIIRSFSYKDDSSVLESETLCATERMKPIPRDLWTQYVCEACGNRILRGAHEWEQHKQGRGHRKRICHLKKSQSSCFVRQPQPRSE